MLNEGPNFDSIRQENVYGVEFWSARDLMPLLGYVTVALLDDLS